LACGAKVHAHGRLFAALQLAAISSADLSSKFYLQNLPHKGTLF
jgi:hypothetical protein